MAEVSPRVGGKRSTMASTVDRVQKAQLKGVLPYLMPAVLLLMLFDIWPIFFGFFISLWKWGVRAERFIGLGNYQRLLTEEIVFQGVNGWEVGELGQSFLVTSYYVFFTVPIALLLAFVLAVLLFQKIPLRGLYRTIFFVPFVTSQVAAAMVFKWIFHPQVGVANAGLAALGIPPQTWLQDPDPVIKKVLTAVGVSMDWLPDALAGPSLALFCIILFSIWASIGFDVIIFLAGLGAIPKELYEAARVDGAEGWQLVRNITFPLISPTTFFLLVVSIIRSFQNFNAFYAMADGNGHPLQTTLSMTLAVFRNFYQKPGHVGYAAAFSFVLFFIILGLTVIQFKVGEKRVHYS